MCTTSHQGEWSTVREGSWTKEGFWFWSRVQDGAGRHYLVVGQVEVAAAGSERGGGGGALRGDGGQQGGGRGLHQQPQGEAHLLL